MSADRITVRTVKFEYPDDLDPVWSKRLPEFSCAANAVSALMPYVEPYVVKSVRAALPELAEPLRTVADDYLHQELQHHVQHRKFNDILNRRYTGLPRVEVWMRKTFNWFSRTRSLRFNLAFAAGFETVAYTSARWVEAHLSQLFPGADPIPSTLFLWHLAEEVEHKSAAFDVFQAIDGSRLRYAWAMTVSMIVLGWFTVCGAWSMLWTDRRFFYPVAHFRLLKWAISFMFELFPAMLISALPNHHPSDFTDPIWLSEWLTHFDPEAGTMPVWTLNVIAD